VSENNQTQPKQEELCDVGWGTIMERERESREELRGRKEDENKQAGKRGATCPSPALPLPLCGWSRSREEHEAGAEMSAAMGGNGLLLPSSSPSHGGHYSCLRCTCTPLPSRRTVMASHGHKRKPLDCWTSSFLHGEVTLDHPDRRGQEHPTRGSNANPGNSLR
jgi:hypothetical protein